MKMDAALATYVAESRELLEDMEEGLLGLESGEGASEELLNSLFRAVHTIKGSAGLFGLDEIVSFTHEVESVLDRLRNGSLQADGTLLSLLFECQSHIVAQIEEVDAGNEQPGAAIREQAEGLVRQLQAVGGSVVEAAREPTGEDPLAHYFREEGEEQPDKTTEADHWHISLRFHRNCLREGMDPMSFLRFLQTLGEIVAIVTLDSELPDDEGEYDPEECYLGFEVGLHSDADKQTIEDVFEFVREDSSIRILPPHSKISEYIRLLESLPEDKLRLGEMLIECRSLTRAELEEALRIQAERSRQPLGEILVESGAAEPSVVDAAIRRQGRESSGGQNRSIRVDADRLDSLVDLIGELVTAGASTALNARQAEDPALQESITSLTGLVEEVRDAALQLRMVQIGATFNRFRRVVRDVARGLGKKIDLQIDGADTELDKTVVERIGDPLMHLVRNAIDHGIESPQERMETGKSEAGDLMLNAYHDSGSIVIEIRDDGRGLDAERIRQKAADSGIISADQELSSQEIHELIFEPGLSTAQQLSDLSGRGVGMDVVRSNIEELGGRVEIESELGHGTTLRVYLPLTLAIIDGFLVSVGESSFVVPLDSVLECVELQMEDASERNGRQYMDLRGEVLPFICLRDLFNLGDADVKRENVVVVRCGNQKAGLVVDELHGELQTVIKPLGPLFSCLKGVSGSTILGNGSVALIVDVPTLVQRVTATETQTLSASVPVGKG